MSVKIWVLSNLHQWEDEEIEFDMNWKVWNDKNDIVKKSELMQERNVKKKEKQREKWEKKEKIRKTKKFGLGGTWSMANA